MSPNGKRPDSGKGNTPQMPRAMRTMSFWILMLILLFVAMQLINYSRQQEYEIYYSRFMSELEHDNIKEITFEHLDVKGRFRSVVSITMGAEAVDVDAAGHGDPIAGQAELASLARAQRVQSATLVTGATMKSSSSATRSGMELQPAKTPSWIIGGMSGRS